MLTAYPTLKQAQFGNHCHVGYLETMGAFTADLNKLSHFTTA